MKYHQIVTLKNGAACCLRSAEEADGQAVLALVRTTHGQTDYMLSYPDECGTDAIEEGRLLKEKAKSRNEAEIIALVEGKVAGSAGISAVGIRDKVRHRARFGISVAREFWRLGIGSALVAACIACAKDAGYLQLELDVAAENTGAIALYEKAGFREYGRNPWGMYTRSSEFQEVVLMRLDLSCAGNQLAE